MPSEQDQRDQAYYDGLPPERQAYFDAMHGKPIKPKRTPKDTEPYSPGVIFVALAILFTGTWIKGWEFFSYLIGVISGTEPMRRGDGWIGLTFVALIFGALGWYFIWEMWESRRK